MNYCLFTIIGATLAHLSAGKHTYPVTRSCDDLPDGFFHSRTSKDQEFVEEWNKNQLAEKRAGGNLRHLGNVAGPPTFVPHAPAEYESVEGILLAFDGSKSGRRTNDLDVVAGIAATITNQTKLTSIVSTSPPLPASSTVQPLATLSSKPPDTTLPPPPSTTTPPPIITSTTPQCSDASTCPLKPSLCQIAVCNVGVCGFQSVDDAPSCLTPSSSCQVATWNDGSCDIGSFCASVDKTCYKAIATCSTSVKKKLAADLISKCKSILASNPDNRCCKYVIQFLASEEGKALSNEDVQIFFKCIKTGIENPDSGLGCYAMTPDDYSKFGGFFDKVIRDYHGDDTGQKKHVTDWNTGDADYDVKKLGQDELSMRVRVGRNLTGFNLPGRMSKEERIKFELKMIPAFGQLIQKYGGKVHSLTPDFGDDGENKNLISQEKYQELVDAHVMFKDMAADSFLSSAGISNDWPYGRGCWQSEDGSRIIWFGEEDQLRIMCMKKGTNLLSVFTDLNEMLGTVEGIEDIEFAKDDNYGYVTSCPSNLGTGMRASVHLKIPNLTADGTDAKAKEVCKPLGLSVRGTGGEHTPIGADGTVDISPSSRLFIKESEIIGRLYEGIEKLMAIEQKLLSEEPQSDSKANEETDQEAQKLISNENIEHEKGGKKEEDGQVKVQKEETSKLDDKIEATEEETEKIGNSWD